MPDLTDRLQKCFEAVFPSLSAVQAQSATLGVTPDWDSLASIRLIAVIEDEFSIRIAIDDYEQLTSFRKVHDYLMSAERK